MRNETPSIIAFQEKEKKETRILAVQKETVKCGIIMNRIICFLHTHEQMISWN